jgi:flavodoxin short chain
MMKTAVIYWSGTGNTEMMAEALYAGIQENDQSVKCIRVDEATLDIVKEADVIALGCPSMGDEVLEEDEMEPFVESIKDIVANKKVLLFGSYGWGDGEWMRDWEARMEGYQAHLILDSLIINETPSQDDLEACKEVGRKISL